MAFVEGTIVEFDGTNEYSRQHIIGHDFEVVLSVGAGTLLLAYPTCGVSSSPLPPGKGTNVFCTVPTGTNDFLTEGLVKKAFTLWGRATTKLADPSIFLKK